MSLLALQTAFRDETIAGDGGVTPSSLGMAIYRDAYRGRLLAALDMSFERTRRWVGAETFTTAACHYILTHPPQGWSLDDYGGDFPDLLADLFAGDPEVAELAWLEWQMQRAFAAPDAPKLDPAILATSRYTETDWDRLGFAMAAGFAARSVATNCTDLWTALADHNEIPVTAEQAFLLVWRSDLSPRFRICDEAEYLALSLLAQGGTLGNLAPTVSTERLAAWLTQWLGEGIFADAAPR